MEVLVVGGKLELGDIHKERRLIGAYVTKDGERVDPDQETLTKIEEYVRSQVSGTGVASTTTDSVIKGFSASWGVARGAAKIILSSRDFGKLNPGDILVTTMTSVDFVPIMEKAAAFVTNEGGVTSHASIVAREMGKPCIIGTKIATQVLKDGMMIEVDADRGVVKILESKSSLEPKNYIRMFAQKSFPYLFSNIFLGYYGGLGVLSITGEKNWMSFFPKDFVKTSNEEGRRLYTSKQEYHLYKTAFDKYISDSTAYFKAAIQKDMITAEAVKNFCQQVSNLFLYYSKTEFFYTDGVKPEEMAITIKEFDDLKLSGRAYLNNLFFEDNGYGKTFIRKISQQTGVTEKALLDYGVDELADLVGSSKKLTTQESSAHQIFFESKDFTLFGFEAKPLIEKFFAEYLGLSNIIKGTVASQGKARGKARVLIPDAKDFDKIAHAVKEMKEGEILIAETTSPDIIAACKKAAAIVTNQGGQLSHAAIISRELGIPCIIGTDKDVILNIRTGDEIEVDANNGIIRILK